MDFHKLAHTGNFFDKVITWIMVQNGYTEINPFFNYTINVLGVNSGIGVAFFLSMISIYVLFKGAKWILPPLAAIYLLIVVYNLKTGGLFW